MTNSKTNNIKIINGIEYKEIPNFNNYFINFEGDVISFRRNNILKNGHHLSKQLDKSGYIRVCLMQNNKLKHVLLHRLVAETYMTDKTTFKHLPNEKVNGFDLEKLEVNHKDENKTNNHVDNLEWCTHKYNSNYGTRTERIIPKTIDKTRTPVDQYDDKGILIKSWYSTNDAARTLGIVQQNITKCCQGSRKHAGGFVWKYHNGGR